MVIVGAGRVGMALAARAEAAGERFTLLDRTSDWSALDGGSAAILVAVRNDDLGDVIARVPASAWDRLVFCQNGMLRSWLIENGLGRATRGLLYFAVPKRGDDLTPGAEPSPFCGPVAREVVEWLSALDVPAREVSGLEVAAAEVEKLIWNCVFGLVCQRHDCTVGDAVRFHKPLVHQLVNELRSVARAVVGVDFELAPLVDRLMAYSLTIADYKGSVKEWRWRNGWFVESAARYRVVTPLHDDVLAALGYGAEIERARAAVATDR